MLVGLLATGCKPWEKPKQSIVLILVEGLGSNDGLCSENQDLERLHHLQETCGRWSRYLQVFAPSTLTQPTLTSLMSSQSPSLHGVLHNGAVGLSNNVQTLAEVALENRYRTGFFSGGLPILNKFGIGQGYEVFNLHKKGEFFEFRPAQQTLAKALNWIDDEVGKGALFATFYLPDRLNQKKVTTDDFGEERSLGKASHLLEINESLNEFIGELKKRNRWRQTHLVVLGVSGSRYGVSLAAKNQLSQEALHVSAQYLSPQRSQEPFSINSLMSHQHFYPKIRDLFIGKKWNRGHRSGHMANKFVETRSDWEAWRRLDDGPRYGLVSERYFLFFGDRSFEILDRIQANAKPVALDSPELSSISEGYASSLNEESLDPCFADILFQRPFLNPQCQRRQAGGINQGLKALVDRYWAPMSDDEDLVEKMSRHTEIVRDTWLGGWLEQFYYRKEKWSELYKLSQLTRRPALAFVAAKRLGQPTALAEGCLSYFSDLQQSISQYYQKCEDASLLKVIEGIGKLKKGERPGKRFQLEVKRLRSVRQAKNRNFEMGFINDTAQTFDYSLTRAELYFLLPSHQRFRKYLENP